MASSSSSSASPPPAALRPPWVILRRAARVQHDVDVEAPSLSLVLELADPPYISQQLTLLTSAHPKPTRDGADKCLYVIAANDAGVLLLVSRDPLTGFDPATNARGTLLVARDFLPAADGLGARTGTAARLPRRETLQLPVCALRNIGVLPVPGGVEYVVAELVFFGRGGGGSLVTFRSGSDFPWWSEQIVIFPVIWGNWKTHDVIAHDGKLWWVDLTQGLLGCNVLDHKPDLRYVELPEIFAVKGEKPEDGIKRYRFVGVSNGRLRFVDFAQKFNEPPGKRVVAVWTLVCDLFAKDDDSGKPRWELQSTTTLGMIWASHSYKESWMPEKVPVVAFVHPHKPDVVYFFLTEYTIFAVDVRSSEVVEFVRSLDRPSVDYCLPWVLPRSGPNGISASCAQLIISSALVTS